MAGCTAGAERRTDAPMPPGDGIFNSADDQFFGGLASGNDGIYGTADDYYTATVDPNIALGGGHVDSDADNNKELLDTNNDLGDFSVADFVDFIQTLANACSERWYYVPFELCRTHPRGE